MDVFLRRRRSMSMLLLWWQWSGRQGNWMARLCLVAFLVLCLSPQESSGFSELIINVVKIIKDLPNLGRALNSAVNSVLQPVFPSGSPRSRDGRGVGGGGGAPESYCFGELGCISVTDDFRHPIYRPINLEPFSREKIGVSFKITSKEDRVGVVVPALDVQQAQGSSFKPYRKTKVIIHGYLNGRDMPFLEKIPSAFLRNYDVNVIWVDWTDGSITLYNRAAANARLVGLEVAHLINWLKNNMGLNPEDVHIIAHSLGCHVCGYTGEKIPGLGRITALDPAEPLFQHMPTSVRLDPSDATFVDVIHTDSGSILHIGQGFGLRQPIGHLDFYPNDGKEQPGCRSPLEAPLAWLIKGVKFDKVWHAVEDSLGCNHLRAVELFVDSIESQCPYMAFRCDSFQDYKNGKCASCGTDGRDCAPMGLHADAWSGVGNGQEQVQLFASTDSGPHYCLYHYQVEVELGQLSGSGLGRMGQLYTSFVSSNGQRMTFDLTSGRAKMFNSQGQYTFFLEHSDDLGDVQEALVKWVMSRGSRSHDSNISLQKLVVRNVDTQSMRSRLGRPSDFSFCTGQTQSLLINNDETVTLSSSANC